MLNLLPYVVFLDDLSCNNLDRLQIFAPMEQYTLKIKNNCLNTNIYSYLETFGGQSSNLYLNVVHSFRLDIGGSLTLLFSCIAV